MWTFRIKSLVRYSVSSSSFLFRLQRRISYHHIMSRIVRLATYLTGAYIPRPSIPDHS